MYLNICHIKSVIAVSSSTSSMTSILSSSPIFVTRITDPDLLLNLEGGLVEAPDFMEIASKSTVFVLIEPKS